MSRVLVTGAAGFVGSHLVRRLHAQGHKVVATDVRPLVDLPVPVVPADLADPSSLAPLVVGVESVFHAASMVQTAWTRVERLRAVNVGGTVALLEAARTAGVRRFVYVSSASVVYAGRDILGGDESLPYATQTQSPYSDTKIEAERAVLAAHDAQGLATISIRPHVVYGPGDGRFMPAIVARARAGKLTMGVGRGRYLSDFTYIDNLIDALVLADQVLSRQALAEQATRPQPGAGGQAYFVSNGDPMGFWEFVDLVLVELGLPATRARVPYGLAFAVAACAEWYRAVRGVAPGNEDGMTRYAIRYMCTHHYFDIGRATRELGYQPAVSTPEGIRRTIASLPPA